MPWARSPELNHLRPPTAVRALLEEVAWIDESDTALLWHQERLAAMPTAPLPLGLHLVLGEALGEMFRNQARNLEERRISIEITRRGMSSSGYGGSRLRLDYCEILAF